MLSFMSIASNKKLIPIIINNCRPKTKTYVRGKESQNLGKFTNTFPSLIHARNPEKILLYDNENEWDSVNR